LDKKLGLLLHNFKNLISISISFRILDATSIIPSLLFKHLHTSHKPSKQRTRMRTSSILFVLSATCASARVIPSFLLSTATKPGVISRTADESIIIRRQESSVIRDIRETMAPGRVRIDDIVEIELTR
jgi:hypothetical protein